MTFSIPGLIGAALGLLCALVAYLVIAPQLKRGEAESGTPTATGDANPNAAAIRAILLADFVVLAAVGYFVGQLFG
jgi:hypothetical protein